MRALFLALIILGGPSFAAAETSGGALIKWSKLPDLLSPGLPRAVVSSRLRGYGLEKITYMVGIGYSSVVGYALDEKFALECVYQLPENILTESHLVLLKKRAMWIVHPTPEEADPFGAPKEIHPRHHRWEKLRSLLKSGDSRDTVKRKLLAFGALHWRSRLSETEQFVLDKEWLLDCTYDRSGGGLLHVHIIPNDQ